MDILALLQCLSPYVSMTVLKQLSRIAQALLAMSGRVTMLGVSRWAGAGGSYRTVQRFFHTALPWALMFWWFFRARVQRASDVYLLAGDEVVVTKAGKHTHGLGRFFSSLYGKPVPGLSFFALSLVSVQERRSFPIRIAQFVREASAQPSQAAPRAKRGRGRPKGSRNKDKTAINWTPELAHVNGLLAGVLKQASAVLPLSYLLLDGHFGNAPAAHMARQHNLHLISKLRHDAALYWPYDGPYAGRGPHRKYGPKLDVHHIPERYLKHTTTEGNLQTRIYQATLRHKQFAQPLNVVLIVKTNLRTHARAHVILFSTDLELAAAQLIDFYSLRFQIEFNFRDAKQYWGLEDFMNVSSLAVTNAANLSLFMVNLTDCLLRDLRRSQPDFSVLDLKAYYRGHKYVAETLKLLPQMPEPILLAQIFDTIAALGRIHPVQPRFSSA